MTFYHRTLCHASGITHSVLGNFIDEGKEDIAFSTGRFLKLLRFELVNNSPVIQTLMSIDTYATICSLSKFRRKEESKDWVIITTDSGDATIVVVNVEKMAFEVVLQDKFKAKIPRKLAVQHLSVDSQGRAVSLAAVVSAKQFWFFSGSDKKQLHILDYCERGDVTYDIAFVDINSENLVFAYLATPYEELHVGVKYEIKKRQTPYLIFCEVTKDDMIEIKRIKCLDHANSLISVPGENGVLVCAEDFIAFYSVDSSDIIRCSIPKRIMDPRVGIIFVCSTKCDEKLFQIDPDPSINPNEKNSIYYLAQTEQGDIFKIQLVINDFGVNEIILQYFITLPVASALCALESRFLFVASEFGNHHFYKIATIEKHARCQPSFSSSLDLPKGGHFFFMHRTLNIPPVAEIKNLSPIMQMECAPLSSARPRVCLATGRGSLSAVKISEFERDVTYAFRVKIVKERSEEPLHMWAVEGTPSIVTGQLPETFVVVSFKNSTAVYCLDKAKDYVMQKIEDTVFATSISTIGCAKTGEDAIVQVCPEGICLITGGNNTLIFQPEKTGAIQKCTMNRKSLIVSFQSRELKHYEIGENGHVKKPKISRLLNGNVTCMHLSDKSESDQLLAVGIFIPPPKTSSSGKSGAGVSEIHLFIVSVSEIKVMCMLDIEHSAHSFLFMNDESDQHTLLVGCQNGTILTLALETAKQLTDEETTEKVEHTTKSELKVIKREEIGSDIEQLFYVPAKEDLCILALSNHSWMKRTVDEEFVQLKTNFTSCICVLPERFAIPKAIATILDDSFRAFVMEDLEPKSPVTIPLEYTPKQFAVDSCGENVFIIETDYNCYTEKSREQKKKEFEEHVTAAKNELPASDLPAVQNIPRSWASLLRVVNLSEEKAREIFKLILEQNEAALSFCHFDKNRGNLLFVGVAKDFNFSTVCCTEASVYIYDISEDGQAITFLHKMLLKSAPLAMCHYEENLLIGTGRKLALYRVLPDSLKLELVCEKKDCVSNSITAIYALADRILVSDSKFGISCLVCVSSDDSNDGSFHLLEEDIAPNELTAACILNDHQMVRATKSRDIFIVELGGLVANDTSKDYNEGELPCTLSKEKLLACFHVGEIVTSIQEFSVFPNELNVLYTTLSGSVGILALLPCAKDKNFLNSLNTAFLQTVKEIDKRYTHFPLSKNLHFRSRHFKCENVIDGDFLEQFLYLGADQQRAISQQMKENISEISTELENMRRAYMLDFQF